MNNSSKPHDTFQIGDLLNNTYRIEGVLGRGGTSEVYRARSEISGRVVAVKVLRSEFSGDEGYLALMRREEDIREIQHSGIVRYFDNQRTDDGMVFLVMDYVQGVGIDQKMKSGGMPADDLVIIAKRVAEALDVAHSNGITHRDLSPDNIILRDDNPADPVIIDFGIAKDENPGAQTVIGNEFAGKYSYAAPEQLSGQADNRSDIYALGALLLAAYRGKSINGESNLLQVVESKSKPLDTSGVPEPLKTLIDRMADPDIDRRLQSAADVLLLIQQAETDAVADDSEKTVVIPFSAPTEAEVTARDILLEVPTYEDPGVTQAPRPSTPTEPVTKKTAKPSSNTGRRMGMLVAVIALAVGLAAAFMIGAFDGLLRPQYATASPYTLSITHTRSQPMTVVGHVPSQETSDALQALVNTAGGMADLTLATGEISQNWGPAVLGVVETVSELPEWGLSIRDNDVQISGLASDAGQKSRIRSALSPGPLTEGLNITAEIVVGPRILPVNEVYGILGDMANCGELQLLDVPKMGYPIGAQITVGGQVAQAETRADIQEVIASIAGDRSVAMQTEILNPTLCSVQANLPNVPVGSVRFDLMFTDRTPNPGGRYLVGDNPVIDVVIPADMTEGYLYVIALDVSGSVFHILPNILNKENDIAKLRGIGEGAVPIPVAYSLQDSENSGGTKLAFVVDDTVLGKTQLIALHSDTPLFEGLRPTAESALGFIEALNNRQGRIKTLDSRILTTAQP
jgi:eukaryotic-like serine/threonine-protein kinase